MANYEVFSAIQAELRRQLELKQAGRFDAVPADPDLNNRDCLTILVEEVGEVARALQEGDNGDLEKELVQVAAVCVSWLKGLDIKDY